MAAPRRSRRFDERALLARTGAAGIDELWAAMLARPFPSATAPHELAGLSALAPAEGERVRLLADAAIRREVDLLGTGPVRLGHPAVWQTDLKTGATWPLDWAPRIDYVNLERPSDVKVPWEISRFQWLLPVGQAYLLEADEACAQAARTLLDEWIEANPYGRGINWSVTMEVALRAVSWSWLFHVFGSSVPFSDSAFRSRFLRSLYLHGDWTSRNLELSDVNGNHLTANAAGLVCAGLVFGGESEPARWAEAGAGDCCWRSCRARSPATASTSRARSPITAS